MSDQKKIVVIGSIAYDHVMQYGGLFEDVIMPDSYSFSLSTSDRAVFYGGCGGNIAYSLKLLGQDPTIITVVGKDFDDYKSWLDKNGIDSTHIQVAEDHMTASAFIVTDKEEKQITLFDPGAMHARLPGQNIKSVGKDNVSWVMIAPDLPPSMMQFVEEALELGIPYIFDPAQQMGIFDPADLFKAVKGSHILIVNEYEAKLLSHMLSMPLEEISKMPKIYIETHGARGCRVRENGTEHYVKAVQPDAIVDPTGCGDAFRAGVIAGLGRGFDIEKACKMGALMAVYALEAHGCQSHSFAPEQFAERFQKSFGEAL